MKKRLLVSIALLCVPCLINAATKKKVKPPPTPAELGATHGYVRASIPQWEFASDFRLVDMDKSREPGRARLETRHGTRSWEGWVRAGEYVLAGDLNAYGGPKRAAKDAAGQPYAPVTVRAGEITDLGVVLRIPIGNYEYKLVPLEDAVVASEIEQALGRVRGLLKSESVIRWRPATLPRAAQFAERESTTGLVEAMFQDFERDSQAVASRPAFKKAMTAAEFLPLALAATPPTSDEPAVGPAGNLYYGADLGQLRVRDAAGSWSHRDTGTFVEVTAVDYGAGRLVAGNLRGQVLSSMDDGKSWSLSAALDPRDIVLDIDRAGDRWIIIAVPFGDVASSYYLSSLEYPPGMPKGWQLEPMVKVYGAARDDLSDITLLREIPVIGSPEIRAHQWWESDWIGGLPSGNYYFVHALSSLHRLNLGDMQWKDLAKHSPFVQFMRGSPDGKFLSAVSHERAAKHVYSEDFGDTWKEHQRPISYTYDLVLTGTREGRSSRATLGRFFREFELYEFDSTTRRWKRIAEVPKGCVRLLKDAEQVQRYCVTRNGDILSLQGEEWKLEPASR